MGWRLCGWLQGCGQLLLPEVAWLGIAHLHLSIPRPYPAHSQLHLSLVSPTRLHLPLLLMCFSFLRNTELAIFIVCIPLPSMPILLVRLKFAQLSTLSYRPRCWLHCGVSLCPAGILGCLCLIGRQLGKGQGERTPLSRCDSCLSLCPCFCLSLYLFNCRCP